MIKTLSIENFKSIKSLNIDCKKINLFIGKPNVGKSNIIEALSMFNIPFLQKPVKNFDGITRFNNLNNLFYDNSTQSDIKINTDIAKLIFRYNNNINNFDLLISSNDKFFDELLLKTNHANLYNHYVHLKNQPEYQSEKTESYFNNFRPDGKESGVNSELSYNTIIRRYTYNENSLFDEHYHLYLLPPYGRNLNTIIKNNRELLNEIPSFFDDNKLEFVYDYEKNIFYTQKKIERTVYLYPYILIADTLKRIIFYFTAIETNKQNILLFEEPETHSFPPYTRLLAERIASSDNQYFISTHSPYLLTNIIENTNLKDLNVFITYFDNYETKVKRLTDKQIREMLDDYIDIFYNLNKYVKNA